MRFLFTNTGYHEKINEYAKIIENRLGKKINYCKEGDYYYYEIANLETLLKIISLLDREVIISTGNYAGYDSELLYILEVYDDWRE